MGSTMSQHGESSSVPVDSRAVANQSTIRKPSKPESFSLKSKNVNCD